MGNLALGKAGPSAYSVLELTDFLVIEGYDVALPVLGFPGDEFELP